MKMIRNLILGVSFAFTLSACVNRDGSPKTLADTMVFDRMEEQKQKNRDELDRFRFKCNVFLSSYDTPIFDKQKDRYLNLEEKDRVKRICENRFGAFPNDNYVLSDERIRELKLNPGVL